MVADNWQEDMFFGLHYDLHPYEGDTELGRETTYDHIREQLEKVKPDYVQYDCKGHPGYTGYPTNVGSPAPGIVNDALKVWREVTRDMSIPLGIHYSGVWDTRAVQLHPDWALVRSDGSADPHCRCPLSGYLEELMIPQLLEVVENYQIDGMWIDGDNWQSYPCYCDRCKAAFTLRTGIKEIPEKPEHDHWREWLAFHRELFVNEHVTKYTDAVHARNPDMKVCSNWLYSIGQPEELTAPVDFLSGDVSPSFGAEWACTEARFFASRGLPWNIMVWTFVNTNNQGSTTRSLPHLCQEAAVVLGQGGAVLLYDQPQRSGRLTAWHQDLLAEVARFCRERQEYCFRTETIPQVAVLHSQNAYYRQKDREAGRLYDRSPASRAMEGAVHAILENGFSADILNEETLLARMADYSVVVVPEQEGVPQEIADGLREYVRAGGHLLLSGADVAEAYPDLVGTDAITGRRYGTSWVPVDDGCVTVPGPWQAVGLRGATEIAPLLYQQEPALNRTGSPAATVNRFGKGTVVAIHGPVFRSYYEAHYPRLRCFIGSVLDQVKSSELISLDGPWWIEMSARKKGERILIQFVNRSCAGHLAANRHVVEDVPDAGPFSVTIPLDNEPTRCYLAPDETGLEWTWKEGRLTAQIAGLGIHNVLVIEQ
jgi:alpha-L-fucosidase